MERLRRLCQNSDKTAAKCKQRKNCENSPDCVKIHQTWELEKILQFLKIQVNYFSLIFMFKFQLCIFTFCLETMSNAETLKEKKIVRTAEEVKKMTATQYLDELVVPILNKALITVNKEVKYFLAKLEF